MKWTNIVRAQHGGGWPGISVFLPLVVLAAAAPAWAAENDARVAQAAGKQDIVAVRELLKQHADVNGRQGDGSTAFLWAAYYSNLEMARTLLAAGANVNAANRLSVTPLLQACRQGDAAMVELLLPAGADPKIVSPDGETTLMAASGAGSVEAVKLLLARGVDVNAKERVQNQTALMWAASEGHLAVVQALLKAGADPNAAAKPASLSREKMGDQGRDWVVHPSGGLTALMFAAREGHFDVARTLVEGGADLNQTNPDLLTALIIAAINDRLDLAGMLIDKGANANDGSLYEAIRIHNQRAVETNHDATRPSPAHTNTLTPLDLIGRLLERGADPNRVATHTLYLAGSGGGGSGGVIAPVNESPFAQALRAQDVSVMRLLLDKRANPNATDAGALPLALAIAGGGRGGFFGFGPPAPFRFPSERTPDGAVKALLEAGADVNAVSAAGDTALHSAAQSGNVAMIQLLADRGARLDAKNQAGFTPLDLAMGKGSNAGRGGRGGGPRPQPQAIALLQKLLGLPPSEN